MARGFLLVRAIVLACCVLAFLPGGAAADPIIERDAQSIFHRVMSPYCPGLMLAACPSSLAEDLRNDIRAELKAGKVPAAIENDLHRRFGDETRAAPAFKGLGRVVWTLPLLLLAGSGWALAAWLRRCRGPAVDDSADLDFAAAEAAEGGIHSASAVDAPPTPSSRPARVVQAALSDRLDDELAAL